ncbi:hypothetical protein [Microtetraspora fusca]|uniref:hypothetical protein n=1 Tax=Microtetraspora fusca TaxID=1997 RepID=UPI00082B114E|nr:hypothetical protein [Microtetraspora fusca]
MAAFHLDAIELPSLPPDAVLTAEQAAGLLRDALALRHGITADVHSGHGVALLSVWVELLVWTNGRWFRWSTGRTSVNGRPVYAFAPAHDVITTARRVALRREELRRNHPYSPYFEGGGS